MKKTIDDTSGMADILLRLKHLTVTSVRQWGTMEANEMLWHCRAQLVLALGEIGTRNAHGWLSKWPFNRLAIHVISWKQNLRTAREMNVKKEGNQVADFRTEREALVSYLQKVKHAPDLEPHPLLGSISRNDWGYLIYKHIDHHLRQFGV